MNDEPSEDHSLDYLYEYDEPRSNWFLRVVLALVLVAGFGVFIAYQLRQNPALKDIAKSHVDSISTRVFGRPLFTAAASKPAADTKAPAAKNPAPAEQQIPPPIMTVTPDGEVSTNKSGHSTGSGADGKSAAPDKPAQGTSPTQAEKDNLKQTSADTAHEDKSAAASSEETSDRAEAAPPKKPSALPGAASREDASKSAQVRNPGDQLYTKGMNYLYGRGGIPKNCDQAVVYLRDAANMGNAKARSQLGGLYATGHCVPLDRAQAYGWFSLAADVSPGRNIWLERSRNMLWSQMTESERQRAIRSR
ncbi:MAG: tetratricopeptide repeat protein [Terriglobales bacterium]